jgi:hypothetical protein
MTQLAKLTPITDLREIWKHEALDFSKWLSEEDNLSALSNAVGIDIALYERESSVGSFSVDLFAFEEGSNRKIIIENQLTDTDHDHLGKIITYAAGKSAEVVIWIVKRARDEHRQAIQWLNQYTDENLGFFLIEIELYKIGNSLPAPRFNIVERPNEWAKTIKTEADLSDTKKLQLDFWQSFCDYAFSQPNFSSNFSRRRKASARHWYDLSVGSSEYHIDLTVNTQKNQLGVGIYILDNKDIYAKFLAQKDTIAQFSGLTLEWKEAEKACRILTFRDADIKKEQATWNNLFDWYCETAIKLKNTIKQFDV